VSVGAAGDATEVLPVLRVVLASAARGLLVDALGVVLAQHDDMELIAAPAHTLDDALAECLEKHRADVLLLDVDGASPSRVIEFLRKAKRACRATRILLLVNPGTEHDVLLIEYVEAGAAGFLHRGAQLDDVVTAIRGAAQGDTVIDRDIFVDVLRRAGHERDTARQAARVLRTLTPREFEILRVIVDGLSNEEIAARLQISVRTVATHVQNVFRKLQVHSRVQAIAVLNRTGLLETLDLRSTA
jgi:DNA-binding NarL/FixJ family response regulator